MSVQVFQWCGQGRTVNDRMCYDSFRLNDVVYQVGDCVLLYPDDDNSPHFIGRIESAFDDSSYNYPDPYCVEVKWFERRTNLEPSTKGLEESEREVFELDDVDINPVGCISGRCFIFRASSFNEVKKVAGDLTDWFFCRGYFKELSYSFKPYPVETLSNGIQCLGTWPESLKSVCGREYALKNSPRFQFRRQEFSPLVTACSSITLMDTYPSSSEGYGSKNASVLLDGGKDNSSSFGGNGALSSKSLDSSLPCSYAQNSGKSAFNSSSAFSLRDGYPFVKTDSLDTDRPTILPSHPNDPPNSIPHPSTLITHNSLDLCPANSNSSSGGYHHHNLNSNDNHPKDSLNHGMTSASPMNRNINDYSTTTSSRFSDYDIEDSLVSDTKMDVDSHTRLVDFADTYEQRDPQSKMGG
eukprot:CAMPEP_0175042514 /NCGR_PEP_ID=MMETSP0052_2-20121109/2615_1 /TAXON_ID=51329 ORGANISM="Polytomella parva, Strain SAG 63-3" /NCGR_SAMPLE_ID=MMETSP0052_2 /ASSEMBLY_ACC=CAM_ASM_000194 /LENGTH=410 /DNA_ID=CAMNT_0016305353 /DNA_START=44 /DNA_END=1273 /DNA_ORIENTATION=-